MPRRVRVRHHVNPLRFNALDRVVPPLALRPGAVEVELGCADARFLFERAPHHPETQLVGLEIRQPLVADVNLRAREAGLDNLVAHFAHINLDLDALFANGRLTRVFINFPDPWFKRRHRKRRLVDANLVAVLHQKLLPGGELFFQSDVWDLALDAMAVFENAPLRFGNASPDGPWSFLRANPYGARSLREVRCEERQLPIWRMLYRRR